MYSGFEITFANNTIYGKTFAGENFCSFHSFTLICESFVSNRGLVDQQYKSLVLPQNSHFPLKTQKVFPMDVSRTRYIHPAPVI